MDNESKKFLVDQHTEALMRRLPDAFRFAAPGQRANLSRQVKSGRETLRLTIGSSRAGSTISLGTTGWADGVGNAVMRQVAARCGLVLNSPEPKGWATGRHRYTNPLGICGVSARWTRHRLSSPGASLRVIGQLVRRGEFVSCTRSVERHGLDVALNTVIEHMRIKVTKQEREAALARLWDLYRSGPPSTLQEHTSSHESWAPSAALLREHVDPPP